MLLELHIAGLGVIDDVTLEPAAGLNVLTGETGAGKTMVTVGLSLALGRRGQSHLIRDGAARASVEARFRADRPELREWAEEGELILARTVGADGRSAARAGGQIAPLATLAELGAGLVELHGQNQAQRLLSPSAQLLFLDRFAGRDHVVAVEGYRRAHEALRSARERLSALEERTREREREKDLLAHQVGEIEGAGLRPGEVAELVAEESRLAHAERIIERLTEARAALEAADVVASAAEALEEVAGLDPAAEPLASRLRSLAEETRDVAGDARSYAEAVELDPARLDTVRERLASIRGLERKYGEGEQAILAYLEATRQKLASLERSDEERDGLRTEVERIEADAKRRAAEIGRRRAEAAPPLSAALQAELEELGMQGATVRADLRPGELGPDGAETVELLFSGGPGQEPRPLSKVASGGELSRTMLACRTVLADLDDIRTLIFDEVDAGIGGRAGVAVGRRLARLARDRQVLVVTHLPQIACFADRHFRVTKAGGTATVTALEEEDRIAELSRMLSGMPTEEAATHAEQLLAEASKEKAR